MNNIIDKTYTYAVIGASSNEEKYGYKVLKHFVEAGFNVVPINPRGGEILKQKVYKKIDEVEQKIDVVIFVVSTDVMERVIYDVLKHNIKIVWLQPGSENNKVIDFCKEYDITMRVLCWNS